MKKFQNSLPSVGALVVYAGRYWVVVAHWPDQRLYLRAPGWEHSLGWHGWDGYGNPLQVATVVRLGDGLLYPA
jgi:hypothetical protein